MVQFSMDFAAGSIVSAVSPSVVGAAFDPLPELQQQLAAAHAEITRQSSEIASQSTEITRQANELKLNQLKIQQLMHELALHKRIRFGVKSEALTAVQRDLFIEDHEADGAAITAEITEQDNPPAATPTQPRTPPTGRRALPPELPRIVHRHEPDSCTCGQCGHAMVKIGEDVSEKLDVEPARFFVHQHIRPQYACRRCEVIKAAAVAPAIIDGGLAAPGLLAWLIIQKYLDHLPLYRIEQICARHGVAIARSTLAEWVGQIGVALQPLGDRLVAWLRQSPVLHADETTVQQLVPKSGKTHRSYLWVYATSRLGTGPPIVVFDYQTSRAGVHARNFLEDWRGHLMVDDYAGYKALFKQPGVIELTCMAHARRRFFDLQASGPHPVAEQALLRFASLYQIEEEGRHLDVAARAALRQTKALPVLADLRQWMIDRRLKTADGSGLAKALDYSLSNWSGLARYATAGNLPIDNNAAENAIRPIAIGRKNWLFAGSERAGKRAAVIQTLLATAKANDIEPYAWLTDTLEKLPTWPNSRIDELLPLRVAQKTNHTDSEKGMR